MKTILLAAAALIAVPAMAQTTGGTGSATPVGSDAKASSQTGQTSVDAQTTPTPAADPSMSQQAPMQNMSTPDQGTATDTMSTTPPADTTGSATSGGMNSGNMTAGGYQPSTPMPMAQPGSPPATFTPGPSVSQAYPAPAPLSSYPICKKGQYDKCRQRGG